VFTNRAFSNAAPLVWNGLPHQFTDECSSLASFRPNLKTHQFTELVPGTAAVRRRRRRRRRRRLLLRFQTVETVKIPVPNC